MRSLDTTVVGHLLHGYDIDQSLSLLDYLLRDLV
jgi:hypothetical protein